MMFEWLKTKRIIWKYWYNLANIIGIYLCGCNIRMCIAHGFGLLHCSQTRETLFFQAEPRLKHQLIEHVIDKLAKLIQDCSQTSRGTTDTQSKQFWIANGPQTNCEFIMETDIATKIDIMMLHRMDVEIRIGPISFGLWSSAKSLLLTRELLKTRGNMLCGWGIRNSGISRQGMNGIS